MIESSALPPEPPPKKPKKPEKKLGRPPQKHKSHRKKYKSGKKSPYPFNPSLKKMKDRVKDPNYAPYGFSPEKVQIEKMMFGASPTPEIKEFFVPTTRKKGEPLLLDERQYVYKLYCDHIASGKSRRSFWYCSDTMTSTSRTIEKYMNQYPQFFPPELYEMAKAKGFGKWENVVEDSALGRNPRANVASIQMIMRNRFDWDRPGSANLESNESEMSRLSQFFVQSGINKTIAPDAIEELPYKSVEDHTESPLPLTPPEIVISDDRQPPRDTHQPDPTYSDS